MSRSEGKTYKATIRFAQFSRDTLLVLIVAFKALRLVGTGR